MYYLGVYGYHIWGHWNGSSLVEYGLLPKRYQAITWASYNQSSGKVWSLVCNKLRPGRINVILQSISNDNTLKGNYCILIKVVLIFFLMALVVMGYSWHGQCFGDAQVADRCMNRRWPGTSHICIHRTKCVNFISIMSCLLENFWQ